MKKILNLLLLILLMLGCSEENGGTEISLDPPVLVSSTPADGATDVSAGSLTIVLTFDQNVTAASSVVGSVDISGATVEKVSAYLKNVSITVSGLEEGQNYKLVVPEGVILGPTQVSAKECSVSFTIEDGLDVVLAENLVTENPSAQAVKVYNFLKESYGQKCLSSVHACVSWNTNEAEWVKYHTGKYPAMTTVDYIHLPASPANWIDYSQIGWIEDWWANNGLICSNWHWIVPRYEGDTDTNLFTYKPEETDFKASNILIEGTWENKLAMADLEKLAGYLKLLKEKNIPLIWRPLHEAAGNVYEYENGVAWFWWGADGPEVYKKLWVLMFDYFKEQGLDNLIWVWTTQISSVDKMDDDYYPGDEYVDIVGRDIYNNTDAVDIATVYKLIQKTYPNKIVTLSELGGVAKVSEQWNAGARWSYFMPWYDYEITNDMSSAKFQGTEHSSGNSAWWNDAFDLENVITRDEMPDLK